MRVDLLTPALTSPAGGTIEIAFEVRNTEAVIERVRCEIEGLPAECYEQHPLTVTLFPDEVAPVTLLVRLPQSLAAGFHELTVRVMGLASGHVAEQCALVEILPVVRPEIRTVPALVTARRRATITIEAVNRGNTDLQLVLRPTDANAKLDFELEQTTVTIAPGATVSVPMTVKARRRLTGATVVHQIAINGEQPPHIVTADAQLRQKPIVPTGALTALTLMCILALWAVAVMFGVRTAMSSEPPKKTVPKDFAAGLGTEGLDPAVVGSMVMGSVTASSTGEPAPRITVELFSTKGVRVAATATKEDGTYLIEGVLPGRYQARFRAEGYEERWFPTATDQRGAELISVVPAKPTKDISISLTGAAGVLSGQVLAGDDNAATVSVEAQPVDVLAQGQSASPDALAATATQQVTAGGTYRFDSLPTPGSYRIRFTAAGFQPQELQVRLEAGATTSANPVRLTAGAAAIAGLVTDVSGAPLGEVQVATQVAGVATGTVTPTTGSVGAFNLDGLPTPATYLVTFAKPGFATQVLAVRLDAGASRTDMSIQLAPATGSVSGIVSGPDGSGLGGATVKVIGASSELSALSFTSGQVGSFRLSGLPLPGTYTIQISSPDHRTETIAVAVDADHPDAAADVRLSRSLGNVLGLVTGANGAAVPSAIVEISDGSAIRSTATASNPSDQVGRYTLVDLAPGSYTVTAKASGYAPRTALITVGLSGDTIVNLPLEVRP